MWGEIILVFPLLMENDVLAAVSPTAISRQLWETVVGVWRSETRWSKQCDRVHWKWWYVSDSTICWGVNMFTLLREAVGSLVHCTVKSMFEDDGTNFSVRHFILLWANILGAQIKDKIFFYLSHAEFSDWFSHSGCFCCGTVCAFKTTHW